MARAEQAGRTGCPGMTRNAPLSCPGGTGRVARPARSAPARDPSEGLERRMNRFLAAACTVAVAAALAVATALGAVALLDRTPEQPNTPLVSYDTAAGER